MRAGRRILRALALSAALATPVGAPHAAAATLEGVVTNASTAQPAAGIEIQLFGEGENGAPRTATTDDGGRFRFEALDPGGYALAALHREVPYIRRGVEIRTSEAEVRADLDVYDTTGSDAAVSIDSLHVLVYEADGQAIVTEMAVFENAGERTYVGDFSPASPSAYRLALSLPRGYTGLQAPEGIKERIVNKREAGFDLALPLLPGSTRILYTYALPAGPFGVELTRRLTLRAKLVNVVMPASSPWRVRSSDLGPQQPVELEGRRLVIARGGPFEKGALVRARVAGGLLGTGVPAGRLLYGLAGLTVAGLTLFWILRFRRVPLRPARGGAA